LITGEERRKQSRYMNNFPLYIQRKKFRKWDMSIKEKTLRESGSQYGEKTGEKDKLKRD